MRKFDHHKSRYAANTSFIDMLFNILIGFVMLLFITLLHIHPPVPVHHADIKKKAELLIQLDWTDGSNNDVDLWLLNIDTGKRIGYNASQSAYASLERDDRGSYDDEFTNANGDLVVNPKNEETITFRLLKPGHYVVNVMFFTTFGDRSAPQNKNIPVHVRMIRLNPDYNVLTFRDLTLPRIGSELTAFRFTITEDGKITDINTNPYQFVLTPDAQDTRLRPQTYQNEGNP